MFVCVCVCVCVCVFVCAVVLPSSQLDTDGPVLQHPGKARPKPARMQRQKTTGPRKPSVKETVDSDVKEEVAIPQPVTEATDQGEGKESVPEQGEKDKNGPEEGEIKKSGPDQGEIKKKGPAEGKIDKNGPDQGEIKKKGLEEGKIDKNGPDQEEIKKKGPEEGEIDKNGTEEGEIKKNGPDQGEIKKKGPEEGEIKKKGPEEGKIMKKEPEEGEIMQTPVSLAEEGEMKEAVLGEVEMKEEPRAVEEISVGPADATVLLQEEPSQVEPAEQIQAVDERDKSVEVEATASLPMADVIEVGLADEEPLALREEGLEAGGTTTEPPPAAMEGAVESVSPVLPPAEVEAHKERDSPAASPKPLPKPRVTKPLAEYVLQCTAGLVIKLRSTAGLNTRSWCSQCLVQATVLCKHLTSLLRYCSLLCVVFVVMCGAIERQPGQGCGWSSRQTGAGWRQQEEKIQEGQKQ